ncbi:phenylalanine--tRNA ligase beta subunit [Nitrospirota bacterium]|jgi:phenylalanyl-tRNA synthetase beta chain|nr:phenylalanine--tRNA ligase beta subunit [Nitrospirota bacterium]GDX88748.1 phenylalanine--tRNA ligase beta subunit [Nitrospirota bacterium]
MPTITIFKQDLEGLLTGPGETRQSITMEQLEDSLMLVKGELKGQNPDSGELRIELQDSNRPDLWCCEGIARQIRVKRQGALAAYKFLTTKPKALKRLHVAPGMEQVRPFVAACTATGYRVTQEGLAQLIQTQEKLAEMFGRKRKTVSIGIYRLTAIEFPIAYDLVKPEDVSFMPLGMDTVMTLGEMLLVHPKGLEFGEILAGQDRLPVLRDATQQPLSFPPIINSREVGEVKVGDDALFVEVTGTDLPMVVLTLNIFAANLADRGAAIEPIDVRYPYKTALGQDVVTPQDLKKSQTLLISTIEQALGQTLGAKEVVKALTAYGYEVQANGNHVTVTLPPYRQDLMHAMDVVEDVAISRGYADFLPVMPSDFTVGGLSRIEEVSDRVRALMVGMGFQEIISNILGSPQDLRDAMRLAGTEWGQLVEVDNVMSQNFSALRQWMLPSLLRVETASNRAFYPHRLFEAGEVAKLDLTQPLGSRTAVVLGGLIAHADAHFSEVHSCLETLFYYVNQTYSLEPIQHPSFLAGRVGAIVSEGQQIGVIGELHPEVLERWQISVPAVAFEIELTQLAERP